MNKKFFKRVITILIGVVMIASASMPPVFGIPLDKTFTLYLCPNTHLDTAWQHPFPEVAWSSGTANGILNMYTRTCNALETAAYAGQLRFTTSASAHLKMLKDYYSADNPTAAQRLFSRVQALVDTGQIDLCGGQIVEPDLNMPNGESMVRQSLYGQHFFLSNFTKNGQPYKSVTGMVPDVFGFNGQMPQFLFKSEIKYFLTSKVNWNSRETPVTSSDPNGTAIGSSYEHFRRAETNLANPDGRGRDSDIMTWRALDGESTVLANFLQGDYQTGATTTYYQIAFNANNVTDTSPDLCGYPNNINFHGGVRATGIKKAVLFYGSGDFGQGMTGGTDTGSNGFRFHEAAATSSPGNLINVKTSTLTEFFEALVDTENLERVRNTVDGNFVDGELYAEFHRGTYTSWARCKKYNRDTEILGESAEKAATIGFYTNSVPTNSSQKIEDAWYKILLNQMHDVLPGSSIAWQYYLTFNHYELVKNLFNGVRDNALAALAYRADTNTVGKPVFVYNELSWPRSGEVTVRLQYDAATMPARSVVVYDGSAKIYPTKITRNEGKRSLDVTFNAKDVPAIGYKIFDVRAEEPGARTTPLSFDQDTWTIANGKLKVRFNPATGYIASLQTIVGGVWKEMFAQGVNTEGAELHVYQDCDGTRPVQNFDQWNVNMEELNREPWYFFDTKPVSMVVTSNTPEKVTISVTKLWNGQNVTQDFTVLADSDRVDVHLATNWTVTKRLLKVSFPILADNNDATFETAFGAVQRPTRRDNRFGMARFEVPMHKWSDVTDSSGGWGVSILNDAKYGNDVLKRTVNGVTFVRSRITAFRVPVAQAFSSNSTFPPTNPTIDRGRHEFNYSIAPHEGSWEDAKTVNKALELNTPMKAFEAAKGPGTGFESSKSFASSNKPNVIITALKNQYDEPNNKNRIIVRAYESSGRATNNVTITLPGNIVAGSAKEVNMLEHDYDAAHGYNTSNPKEPNAYTVKPLTVSGNTVTFNIKKFEALTFQVDLAPSTQTALTVPQQSVTLAYNSRGVTPNSSRNTTTAFIEGTGASTSNVGMSMPAEMWPAGNQIDFNGIKFNLGAANANNFLNGTAANHTVTVNPTQGYSKLYIVGASVGSTGITVSRATPYYRNPAIGAFAVNYTTGAPTEKDITFNSWNTELSGWNRTNSVDDKPYVYDTVAHFNNHYHLHTGNNGEMQEADNYLFVYAIDLDKTRSVSSIEIPVSNNIKIAAMTLADPVDGFGKVYDASDEVDVGIYWDMSDLTAGTATGTNIDKKNISGPFEATGQMAFESISSSGQTLTGTEGANQILVNNGSSKWCGTATTSSNAWFVMDAGKQVKPPAYIIRGANDDMSYVSGTSARILHSWIITGSNSPTGPWDTVISAPVAQGAGWTSNYQTRMWLFDEGAIPDTGFRYYRLQLTHRGNSAAGTALTTSNATMQFSYFGLVTSVGENGNLTAQVNKGQTAENGIVTIATLNGPNFITLTGSIAGSATAPVAAKSYTTVKTGLNIRVSADTKLGYMVKPKDEVSSYIALDLKFSDGTRLSSLKAVDQFGIGVNPNDQGKNGTLNIGEWNYVETSLGDVANRKFISEIIFGFETDVGTPGQKIEGALDNVVIYRGDGGFEDVNAYGALYNAEGRLVKLSSVNNALSQGAYSTVALKSPIVLDKNVAGAGSYIKTFVWTREFVPVTEPVRYQF